MKKTALFLLFFTICVFIYAQDLSWDIKFEKGNDFESVPISQIIRVQTGEIIQFAVTPASNANCYVFLYDSQREIAVLHDQPISAKKENIFGPFELTDPPGTETIYVILSLQKQTNLEKLINEFNKTESKQAGNNLYREVVSLQNSASKLGEPASLYIPSGGTTRGKTSHITRFSGHDLYVRAISVRH